MSFRCQLCGKKKQHGHNVSHSKRRTKRIWKPNLQWITLAGKRQRLCTKCIKRLKKDAIGKVYPERSRREVKKNEITRTTTSSVIADKTKGRKSRGDEGN